MNIPTIPKELLKYAEALCGDLDDIPKLTTTTKTFLKRDGINTVAQLYKRFEDGTLRHVKGIGDITMMEVEICLGDYFKMFKEEG